MSIRLELNPSGGTVSWGFLRLISDVSSGPHGQLLNEIYVYLFTHEHCC